jgi:hypothetical protein
MEPCPPPDRLSEILKTVMIVALLGAGWCAWLSVEFHLVGSILQALRSHL